MKKSPKIVKLDINEEDNFSGVDSIALVESPAIEAGFMFFSNHAFQSYTDYPDSVSNNAQRGIELNEKVDNRCATQVGKVRAQQLANREAISLETIKRMYSYLSRAEAQYRENEGDNEACSVISYLLWGGLSGKRYSESKLKELGLLEELSFAVGMPHYTKDGKLYEGPTHKQGDRLMTGATHTEDSEFLYHIDELGIDVSTLPNYVNEPSGSLIVKDVFVENAGGFSVGDYVSWTFAGRGDDADRGRGQIIDLRVSGEVNVPETDVTLTATKEEPVALITTRSGKVVGQYTRNLRKIQKPDGFDKAAEDKEMVDGIVELILKVKDLENRKQIVVDAIRDFAQQGVQYNLDEFLQKVGISMSELQFYTEMEDYFRELFDFLTYIDDLPVYSTPEEAEEVAKIAGCSGHHEHILGDITVYMPCESHEDSWDSLLAELFDEFQKSRKHSWDELSDDQKDSLLEYLDKVAVDSPDSKDKFNTVKTSDIKSAGRNFGESFLDTPSTKIRYQYEGPVDSKNRNFCRILMTRYTQQGKVFRKEDINNMSFAGVNTGFGPNGINEYNIFLYRGGNNCRHEWKTVLYTIGSDGDWMNSTKEVSSIAQLQNIIAPRNPQTELGVIEGPLGIGTQFSKQNFADQQIVAGPFMIPNKLIPRIDEDDDEYFVYFSDDTIKKIAYKYMQNKYTDSTNIEHLSDFKLNEVFVVESWLVEDPKRDKSLIYSGGEEYPKGTWYGLMKVKNKGVWENYVKTGLVKGFSVEGFFIDELLNKTKV